MLARQGASGFNSPLTVYVCETGRTFQDEGLWEQAAVEYQRALTQCGDDAGLYNSLGQAQWQSGLPEKALISFKQAVKLNPQNPYMVFNLGSLLHWEGQDLTAAEIALEKAIQLGDEQGGNELLAKHASRARERCRAASALRIKQENIELAMGEAKISEVRASSASPWQDKVQKEANGEVVGHEFHKSVGPVKGHVMPVDERSADDLSYEEFMREYAHKSRPVVIKGLAAKLARSNKVWTTDTIVELCGDYMITPRVFDKSSSKWAGLEDLSPVSVRDFIRNFEADSDSKGYLFDWGLPKSCTQLLADFVVPKYFAVQLRLHACSVCSFCFDSPAGVVFVCPHDNDDHESRETICSTFPPATATLFQESISLLGCMLTRGPVCLSALNTVAGASISVLFV